VSYALDPHEDAGAGLVRIIAEQAAKLREACMDARAEPVAFVHKARVRCKRIRAALRLARPMLGRKAYVRENAWWRDTARGLSTVRDMTARLESLSEIGPDIEPEIGSSVLRRLRWQFDRERRAYEADVAAENPLGRFCTAVAGHDLSALSEIAEGGHAELAHGLGQTYSKAKAAMRSAYFGDRPELFHEWRKQTKYHALQLRLVRQVLPAVEPRIEAARDLAELLGAVQDVEVLVIGLAEGRNAAHVIAALAARRRAMLEGARVAGEALFALKRKQWARTLEALEPVAAV
jgi:CHAD domain-containing protein